MSQIIIQIIFWGISEVIATYHFFHNGVYFTCYFHGWYWVKIIWICRDWKCIHLFSFCYEFSYLWIPVCTRCLVKLFCMIYITFLWVSDYQELWHSWEAGWWLWTWVSLLCGHQWYVSSQMVHTLIGFHNNIQRWHWKQITVRTENSQNRRKGKQKTVRTEDKDNRKQSE